MNFELKSTFKYLRRTLLTRLRGIPHTRWILVINSLIGIAAAYAYFTNEVIPATIGSRYYGHQYIFLLETAGHIMIASSVYAMLRIATQKIARVIQKYQWVRPINTAVTSGFSGNRFHRQHGGLPRTGEKSGRNTRSNGPTPRHYF